MVKSSKQIVFVVKDDVLLYVRGLDQRTETADKRYKKKKPSKHLFRY